MKYIRNYKVFENNTDLTEEQIDFLNSCTRGEWKLNPDTALIDVRGDFDCYNKNLDDFKGLRFRKVTGYFLCGGNNLKTLNGSPKEVGGSFWCERNPLISLEAAPLKVGYYFGFGNFFTIHYNLKTFLKKIKEDRPGVPTELLLTHHFFTPEVIKKEITKDSYFCYYISRAWNTPPFKKKQEELTKILPQEDLQKIDALWSIGGYL
jgi:hypothetical protein